MNCFLLPPYLNKWDLEGPGQLKPRGLAQSQAHWVTREPQKAGSQDQQLC